MKLHYSLALATALLCSAARAAAPEAQLIALLKSDASQEAKADACMQLARVGTRQAVPTLAALLADDQLSHMARYGLEAIPDPSVDSALRDALGTLKGRPLVGVIGSVGVRHDAEAIPALAAFLTGTDADVAMAAARALGSIGTPAAAKALQSGLGKGTPAQQLAVCDSLLRCAAVLPGGDAIAIYDQLRDEPGPAQIRAAALRGAILARQKDGLPLLVAALRGDDAALIRVAVRTSMEMPGEEVTKAIAAEVGPAAGDKQRLLIGTLGSRGDAAAVPALLAVAKEGAAGVRQEAIGSLAQIGSASVLPAFVELAVGSDAEVARAARAALAGFSGGEADAAITGMLASADPKTQIVAIDLISQRRMSGAIPVLLRSAENSDPAVSIASLKTLGELAGVEEVPALLKILMTAKAPAAAESALTAVCTRQVGPVNGQLVIQKAVYGDLPDGTTADVTEKVAGIVHAGTLALEVSNTYFGDPAGGVVKHLRVDYTANGVAGSQTAPEGATMTFAVSATSPACTAALVGAMGDAAPQPKAALLRILRAVGGPQALAATRAATKDGNPEVRDAALRSLCDWPTVEVLPDLMEIARTPPSPKFKIMALRGALRLIPRETISSAQKLAAIQEVLALVERPEEKRLALAALGEIPTAEALALVMKELPDAALQEEASEAAVAIGEKLVVTQPALVADAMRQVVKTTENASLAARARAVLKEVKG
jgi:HEAT repeat protein